MTCSCFGCVVDNLVPRALNFFHLSVKKNALGTLHYCLCGGNFCFRSHRKTNSHKMESLAINVSNPGNVLQRQYLSLLL